MLKVYTSTQSDYYFYWYLVFIESLPPPLYCRLRKETNDSDIFSEVMLQQERNNSTPKKVISFLISFFHRFSSFNCRLSIVL